MLECCPTKLLGQVPLTTHIECFDVDLFPRTAIAAIPTKVDVVILRGLIGALLRSRILQRGKRLGRPAGGQETAADFGADLRPAPVFYRYQRYVGIDVRLGIRDVL